MITVAFVLMERRQLFMHCWKCKAFSYRKFAPTYMKLTEYWCKQSIEFVRNLTHNCYRSCQCGFFLLWTITISLNSPSNPIYMKKLRPLCLTINIRVCGARMLRILTLLVTQIQTLEYADCSLLWLACGCFLSECSALVHALCTLADWQYCVLFFHPDSSHLIIFFCDLARLRFFHLQTMRRKSR